MKKICVALVLLAAGGRAAFGFALIGPFNEPWQITTIGFNIQGGPASGVGDIGGNGFTGPYNDIGGPKNFGQGYRWNVPNVVYAYDSTFTTYFGPQGEAAVDAAFAMFNSLSNVSVYSTNLAEIPLAASRYNYTAANLNLLDIKSEVMQMLIEQLGLAQPDRWVWTLHNRYTGGGLTCGNYEFNVVMRNYDTIASSLTSTVYSKYVNGTLFGYTIFDFCALANPPSPLVADAVEYTTDPSQFYLNLPLAERYLAPGLYFTGLTRDDMMGLRYLYAATNLATEISDPSSLLYYTNTNAVQFLVSSNYGLFLQQALTNGPAALLALYPGLVITSTNFYAGLVVTTNTSISQQLVRGGYQGEYQSVTTSTYTTNYENLYSYTFGNLVVRNTNAFTSQMTEVVTLAPTPGGYVGEYSIVTNYVNSSFNSTNGDFYIIPTNLCGTGYYFLTNYAPVPTVVGITNVIAVSTNGVSNNLSTTITIAEQTVAYFTNYTLVVVPIQCEANVTELRQGIEKVNFVRQDYDSEIGQAWTPITNTYQLTAVSGAQTRLETLTRVIHQPDILITAADLIAGPDQPGGSYQYFRSAPNFNLATNSTSQYGPGTLNPTPSATLSKSGLTFTFNNGGPEYLNGPGVASTPSGWVYPDANQSLYTVWATFDGSTNLPVVYPNSVSLAQLEAQVYFQITSSLLPNASLSANTASSPYSYQLQAQSQAGPPFTWKYATNSTLLPSGLTLSTNGVISGVPTAAQGTYDFSVQAQDNTGRTSAKALFIVIGP